MDQAPPKRRGRPRKTPDTNDTGHASFHIGLRLGDANRDALLRIVEHTNALAREHGIPANVTPSSIVQMWIVERIALETAKLAKKR